MRERSPQQRIDAGARVRNFLNDDAVRDAFEEMEVENRAALLAADTPDARTNVWAEAVVLAKFSARMIGLMEDGESTRQAILARDAQTASPVR